MNADQIINTKEVRTVKSFFRFALPAFIRGKN
jgi:hypothetical protein